MSKILLTVIFFIAAQVCNAQYSFKCLLLDEAQMPVADVTARVGKNLQVAISDAAGFISFNYASKECMLQLSHVSFKDVIIKVNADSIQTIILVRNNDLLPETVVKAFERNGSNNTLAAAVTVLSKNSFERLGTQSLVAAVNAVPGVKMDERSPGSYRLSIRGNLLRSTFGVRNVKVYWNGIPFTDANGNTYLNQLSLTNVGRMEIIKGPSGSMYGSGTGGVVLLSSGATSANRQQYVDVQAAAGSYGLFSGSVAYQQTGKQQTGISFSHQQSDGYRNHTNMRRDAAQYTGSYAISDRRRINANIL